MSDSSQPDHSITEPLLGDTDAIYEEEDTLPAPTDDAVDPRLAEAKSDAYLRNGIGLAIYTLALILAGYFLEKGWRTAHSELYLPGNDQNADAFKELIQNNYDDLTLVPAVFSGGEAILIWPSLLNLLFECVRRTQPKSDVKSDMKPALFNVGYSLLQITMGLFALFYLAPPLKKASDEMDLETIQKLSQNMCAVLFSMGFVTSLHVARYIVDIITTYTAPTQEAIPKTPMWAAALETMEVLSSTSCGRKDDLESAPASEDKGKKKAVPQG